MKNRACYGFDDVIRVEDIDILLDEKSYKTHENTLTDDISYKTFVGKKLWLNEIDGLLKFLKELLLLG